ncbi:MAG: Mor transcription activator family protein [Peptostreptococcaceae bacterium]
MRFKNEDVSENVDTLIQIVGYEKFLEIAKTYGGNTLYIPTYKSAIRESRNREIIKRYNGVNLIQLSKEYRLSVTHIKRIIKGVRE